ncbi:hypothetical protein O0I10_006889 [Lichtheimia ornata]|uniref:Alpha/beta hydrolase fold-3 domain-containing protein n=1 Tax=Lichtheimia ornata TaxID=688661 RepID=A0AAD7XYB6_9FUNG|nr:uncharacterized protein O0I10_006889 [Lichtheimia ornata]KAJ8657336.1 hypothetical protein O0I10_006889 [Lichtheimia ornata]
MTRIHPVYAVAFEKMKKDPRIGSIPIEEYRALLDNRMKHITLPDVYEEERTVTTNDGNPLHLTLLRPLGTEKQVLPVLIYYHGGGWVIGSKHTHGKVIRDICIRANVAIVFVNYKLAPAVKFPAIHEEAFAALEWVYTHGGKELNVDVNKLAVGGDSAGGNLSAAMPLMLQDRHQRGDTRLPLDTIKTQILIYPSTAPKPTFPSYELFGSGDFALSNEEIKFYGRAYASKAMRNNKFMFALLASDEELKKVPPALIITAEADVLRDEGEEYGRRLTDAGVKTTTVRMIGATHGYISLPFETSIYTHSIYLIVRQLHDTFSIASSKL